MKFTYFILVLLLFLISCEDEAQNNSDSEIFIFGTYFGHCFGNCTHLFKMENDALFEDVMDRLNPTGLLEFSDSPVPDRAKNDLAISIRKEFPMDFLIEQDSVLGCPDCADQGGYFFLLQNDQIDRRWQIDTNTTGMDKEIQQYLENLIEKLEKLRE